MILNLKKILDLFGESNTSSTRGKRLILLLIDLFILLSSFIISFWIRLGEPISQQFIKNIWLVPLGLIFAIPVYILTGQYIGLTKYQEGRYFFQIFYRNTLIVLFLSLFGIMTSFPYPPRACWILIILISSSLMYLSKLILGEILISKNINFRKRVVIYGAGGAGAQLAASLKISGKYKIICFVDDASNLWKRKIYDIPIKNPSILSTITNEIDEIMFAIPSISKKQKTQLLKNLRTLKVPVFQIPSIDDITSGKAKIDSLRPLEIDNLLGREKTYAREDLLKAAITNNSICVTGGGGSIGSELCRQIISLNPSKLILIDLCEENLFFIERELIEKNKKNIPIIPYLGNTCDKKLMTKIFMNEKIDVVFHAAAYKHVPIVENNPLSGIYNNVFSTKVICEVAKISNVSKLILISTDKAVRPKNVMGASKRLAELVVQAYAYEFKNQNKSNKQFFSMVRFGNVLNSSGSVVPIFKDQIAKGGPITITHPNIIRYFMTIEEASNLVIQSSYLSKGGEVFLLDMGEPVKINELAEQMIIQSGLTKKDKFNEEGDIEIVFTGLRPGEKLYEELLIDAKSEKTIHPLIFRAFEKSISPQSLFSKLDELKMNIENCKVEESLKNLKEIIPDWENSRE